MKVSLTILLGTDFADHTRVVQWDANYWSDEEPAELSNNLPSSNLENAYNNVVNLYLEHQDLWTDNDIAYVVEDDSDLDLDIED